MNWTWLCEGFAVNSLWPQRRRERKGKCGAKWDAETSSAWRYHTTYCVPTVSIYYSVWMKFYVPMCLKFVHPMPTCHP